MTDNLAHPYNRRESFVGHWRHLPRLIRCDVGRVLTIDDLSDDELLVIFDFYVIRYQDLIFRLRDTPYAKKEVEWWQSLVHVCRRWRCLIYGSPRRLDLQICFLAEPNPKGSLDVWPPLPILIWGFIFETSMVDIIAKLKYNDRICQIHLECRTAWQVEKLWTAMQVPFPELAVLSLRGYEFEQVPVLPDSFLGGSAPRLRYLSLVSVPFPGLPKLLLSTTRLLYLWLVGIPHSGYISPEAIATSLSMLTSLKTFQFEFESPQSSPDQENRRSLPPTRFVLPSLTHFWFKGVDKYLEDLLSRVDAPRVSRLSITFFNDTHFNTRELNQFISRTPTFGGTNDARLIFGSQEAQVRLQSHPEPSHHGIVEVKHLCQAPDRQLSSLAQIFTMWLHLLSTIENLYIYEDIYSPPIWEDDVRFDTKWDDIEEAKWLDVLLPFTAVKDLYLSNRFTPHIAPALQELAGGRTTEVLPSLRNLFLGGSWNVDLVHGIAPRIAKLYNLQLNNLPFAISVWENDTVAQSERYSDL